MTNFTTLFYPVNGTATYTAGYENSPVTVQKLNVPLVASLGSVALVFFLLAVCFLVRCCKDKSGDEEMDSRKERLWTVKN